MSIDSFGRNGLPSVSRRRFVQGLGASGVVAGTWWPRSLWALKSEGEQQVLAGTSFDLIIGETPVNFTGRTRPAITVNGSLPAPVLRWREGTTVELSVRNAIPQSSPRGHETSIHWHGILLPANMDGVPGVSFNGIGPGETYRYQFKLRQSGTYWYHSHSAFQEQAGLYGALIIDPLEREPFHYDRDYVVLLSDWTDLDPDGLFARLKKMSDHDNFYKRTLGNFARDVQSHGWSTTVADRLMWGEMRMTPTDLSDLNANTYTYLMNGTTASGNWTGLFRSGEKVRLRFINGSAMTYFDVRIPGLKMTVVAADGQLVHPVSVDEFRIAVAETYDVLVEPSGQDAYTIFAQDMSRTGHVSGTLAIHAGLRAPVPSVDPRTILTMADMGHGDAHGAHDAETRPGTSQSDAGHAGHDMSTMHGAQPSGGQMDSMSTMRHGADGMQSHPVSETGNPLVDMQVMAPKSRLDDPGIGLRDNGRRVLAYKDLHAAFEDPDGRDPVRDLELHLTGHMERFAWSFNGIKFADAEPLKLNYGERLRIVLVNDSMMSHPIHLHGMWSDLEDDEGRFHLRKHTIDMPPGTRRSYRVRADALGRWAYHCHLLYHMEAGMMRVVRVEE
jgi:CopA family copper-resistance protein